MSEIELASRATELTIEPEQLTFTDVQLAALAQLGVENAPEADLAVFFHQAKRTGLDPFAKQIYMIGRNTKVKIWENGRQIERWVVKYTIQTGIDGYRLNGRRAATAAGDRVGFEGPFWCGEDGVWKDVWPGTTPPVAAKYIIVRNGEPHTGIAHYDEYLQTKPVTGEPNSMWAKMPRNQTAKCAEAQAWRKAFPEDFTGLVLEDAAQHTVIDAEPPAPRRAPAERVTAAEIIGAAKHVATPVENPEPTEPTEESGQQPDTATNGDEVPAASEQQIRTLGELLRSIGCNTRKKQLDWINKHFESGTVDAPNQLSSKEIGVLIRELEEAAAANDSTGDNEQPEQSGGGK